MQWHQFDDEDLQACRRVLDSGTLCSIGGAEVPAFEEEFREARGAPLARAFAVGRPFSFSAGKRLYFDI